MQKKYAIVGNSLPNIPWEEKPETCSDVIWRSRGNPIILRDQISCSNSIFNSAVVPFNQGFAGVFRCDDKERNMRIHRGFSDDGIDWRIDNAPIRFQPDNPRAAEINTFEYGYDPRMHWIEDRFYITWCNGYYGPTIGVGYTFDFETFYQVENAFVPFNRNGVMFPRKINGKYAMLNRPSDDGHTPFGSIFYSESPDMVHWGCHRFVMGPTKGWQSTKIGAGPVPIETSEGWLLFYHGVLTSCNGFVYSMGTVILDIEEPWKIKYTCAPYLLAPHMPYEMVGDVPNVVFPCAALTDSGTGRVAVYYGAADTVVCLAFGYIDEIIDFVKEHAVTVGGVS